MKLKILIPIISLIILLCFVLACTTIMRSFIGPYIYAPAWSPDSKTIAFQRSKPPKSSVGDIYLIDVDGQNLRQLTDTPFDEYECLWSPDGEWIAITLTDPMPPFWDVYLIKDDGSGMYRLRDNMPYP